MMVHRSMVTRPLVFGAAAAAVVMTSVSGLLPSREPASAAESALVARGAYLTGPAGECSDCHGQGLRGGHLVPAPDLAGLVMFASDADAIKFFETALTPAGKHVPPPMPRYMFHAADARAIVAYLRQLR
jgi:mono/diheme cytochrome c family protein